jgi:hypothetical protein
MRFFWGVFSGGVAALNHRLIAAMPPASDQLLQLVWGAKQVLERIAVCSGYALFS